MSVVLLPKIPIVPGEDPEVTARKLHNRKNGPVYRVGEEEELAEMKAYPFKPGEDGYEFPHAMYREWDESNRIVEEIKLAQAMGLDLTYSRQAAMVNRAMPKYETYLAGTRKDFQQKLAEGWAQHPNDVKSARDRLDKAVALAAAERATDDRRLGSRAAQELEAIEDAADHHVVDVSETRRELKAAGKVK